MKTSILKPGGVYNRIKILKSFVLFTKIQFFFFFSHHTRSHALRKQLSYLSLIQCSTPLFSQIRFPRLDYQPLFGKMSPHSSPIFLRGGSKTGPGRRRQSSQEISAHSLLYDLDKRQETFRGALSIQPRPQGFSLKKWVGPGKGPFFEGKALGTRLLSILLF